MEPPRRLVFWWLERIELPDERVAYFASLGGEGRTRHAPQDFNEDGVLVVELAFYRPGRALRRSGSTPILIYACDFDAVAPVGPIVRAGKDRSNVTVNRYPYGHFDIYLGDAFERASADQPAFLKRALLPRVG